MWNYCYTKSSKGFAFSLDAVLAALIVIAMFFSVHSLLYGESSDPYPKMQLARIADDSFYIMKKEGFLLSELDANGFSSTTMANLLERVESALPANVDFNLSLKEYTAFLEDCRVNPVFEDCFPDANISGLTTGEEIPEGREIVHRRFFFARKQPNSECEVGEIELKGENPWAEENGMLYFKGPEKILLQGDVNISFQVEVMPPDEIHCDQNVYITLIASVDEDVRKPVDVMLVMDRSGSMNEFAQGITEVEGFSLDGGTDTGWPDYEKTNWEQIMTFDMSAATAFDVKMQWDDDCGGGCPELYIESPAGNEYGYGRGTPPGGEYTSQTTYNYIKVPAGSSEAGTWKVYGWNDYPAIDVNVYVKEPPTKMNAAKDAGTGFVDFNGWAEEDQLGLVSYSSSATLDEQLTTNRNAVKNEISQLSAGGSTATGEGIQEATDELTSARANPDALKFQVLLSDGQTNTGINSSTAAQNAANEGIIIYTVGFGTDADEGELQNIADITGGEYYAAEDPGALEEVFTLIAQEIEQTANDSNVSVPILPGEVILDDADGAVVDGNLVFDAGSIGPGEPWSVTYTIMFPCDNSNNCDMDAIGFPGEGTTFTYTDTTGTHTIEWTEQAIIDYKYRDLTVIFLGGEIISEGKIYLDVNAANIGHLDSNATEVDFYLGDPDAGGTLLGSRNVSELCGIKNPSCVVSFYVFEEDVGVEGELYAVINYDSSIPECPGNNKALINCYGSPGIRFYSLDYRMWWK